MEIERKSDEMERMDEGEQFGKKVDRGFHFVG
jgi:hypothetical protein